VAWQVHTQGSAQPPIRPLACQQVFTVYCICCHPAELSPTAMLLLAGKAGSTSLKLPFLDPTGLVAWQAHTQGAAEAAAGPGTGSLLLLASPSRRCWRGIQTHINNAVHGVMQVGRLLRVGCCQQAGRGYEAVGPCQGGRQSL
jgi:hypothetical protein